MSDLVQDWRYVLRLANVDVSGWRDKPADSANLIATMERAIEKLKQFDAPIRPVVVYYNARTARVLGVDRLVRARLAALWPRGPRLRSLVRSPSRAKRQAALIEGLARSFGPAMASPSRPWVSLCPR